MEKSKQKRKKAANDLETLQRTPKVARDGYVEEISMFRKALNRKQVILFTL